MLEVVIGTSAIIFCLGMIICFSYHIGKMEERAAWNKLIEMGIIPKPKYRALPMVACCSI